MPRDSSLASQFEERLREACRQDDLIPLDGVTARPVVYGIDKAGSVHGCLENKLHEASQLMAESERVFLFGDEVVMEMGTATKKWLSPLRVAGSVTGDAHAKLCNIFLCGSQSTNGETQYGPPKETVSQLLHRNETLQLLPDLRTYSKRPVFDRDYRLCQPGWYPEQGILVHGSPIEYEQPGKLPDLAGKKAIERLPHHLQQLLRGFCFESDADLANAVGVCLTGLLMTHFIDEGHALVLLDGNQPGVGKTLLAQSIGTVLDGKVPTIIHYTENDEELQKRTLATIRDLHQTCLIYDNAKIRAGGTISSPTIEANSVAPEVCLRILGKSLNFRRPNDLLWFLTMNDTKVSPDIISRCVPIRLFHLGDPGKRKFSGSAVAYAKEHRLEILCELAEMVARWTQSGKRPAQLDHRLPKWACTIGGILEANGLPDFLANLSAAVSEFTAGTDDISMLAEKAIQDKSTLAVERQPDQPTEAIPSHAVAASKWIPLFAKTKMLEDKLLGKTEGGKAMAIGRYLSKWVDREVSLTINGRSTTAILRSRDVKGGKGYVFEVVFEQVQEQEGQDVPPGEPTSPANDDNARLDLK
jgi:hypothetical protein